MGERVLGKSCGSRIETINNMYSNMKTYIGIDNGVSGTIGIVTQSGESLFIKTPVKKEQDYTKKKKEISRIDAGRLIEVLSKYGESKECFIVMERPLVNPTRFQATASALRCHEAELIIIESLGIPFQFVDSKDWQKDMLPKGCEDTKKASLEIGARLFPQFRDFKHPDRDGILMAEWARRKAL